MSDPVPAARDVSASGESLNPGQLPGRVERDGSGTLDPVAAKVNLRKSQSANSAGSVATE
jgi:hypothetical protein